MPSRYLCLAIFSFWLATTGWMFYQELGIAHWYNEPPPFTIDLADEVRAAAGSIDWQIFKDTQSIGTFSFRPQKIGTASTMVQYLGKGDLFELTAAYNFNFPIAGVADANVSLKSYYKVTREGDLREIGTTVNAKLNMGVLGQKIDMQTVMWGPVEDHLFRPSLEIKAAMAENRELTPVTLSERGSVLNPLHPVNRITELRPGQQWRIPLVDPLTQALTGTLNEQFPGLLGNATVQFLHAEVLENPRYLPWDEQMVLCRLIHYQGDETTACTWVRESDGLVLQQEVFSNTQGFRLILKRKPQQTTHPSVEAW